MTNQQMYLLLFGPLTFNAILVGVLMAYINAKFETARAELRRVEEVLDARLKHIEEQRR